MGSAPARRAKVDYHPKVVLRSSGAPRRRGTRPWSSSQRPRPRRGSTCYCQDNTPSTTCRAPRLGARQWRGPGRRPGHSHRCGWLGRPVPDRLRIIVAASLRVRAEQRLVLHSPGSGPGTALLCQGSSGDSAQVDHHIGEHSPLSLSPAAFDGTSLLPHLHDRFITG